MLYKSGLEWRKAKNKRISLFGMSGVGKTFSSNILRKSLDWFHYSVDYRIATKYLGEDIVDDYKKEAMNVPLLRKHLLNDSIYISSNITFDNLSPLSTFLGKPGRTALGGISFAEYLKRQKKHLVAEINATIDTEVFVKKAEEIYGYKHFIADTSGSLCEIVDPKNPEDPVLKSLANSTLPVWIKGSESLIKELYKRFERYPKPMYYNETFLRSKWAEYCKKTKQKEADVDPDKFAFYGFKALVSHRLPIYESIAANWGVTIESEQLETLTSSEELIELISEMIDYKAKN